MGIVKAASGRVEKCTDENMSSRRASQPKLAILLLLVIPASKVLAQGWTLTSAPTNYWKSVAASADGTKIVAVAGFDSWSGTGDGSIHVSTNSGSSWLAADAPSAGWSSVASSPDGVTWLAACPIFGATNGIFLSTNTGKSWGQVTQWRTNGWTSVGWSADGTRWVAADPGGGFLPARLVTTGDAGSNWATTLFSYENWTSLAGSADGSKWMAASQYGFGYVYFSADGAQTWSQTTADALGWSSVACSADGRQWMAASLGGGIYSSTNLGAIWALTTAPNASWTSVASSADGTRLAAASINGPIYVSTNSGANWFDSEAPTNYWKSVSSSADGSKLVAAVGWYDSSSGRYWVGPIYTFQTTPTPLLNIRLAAGKLVFSWTIPSLNFVLQQNGSLTPSGWLDVGSSRTLNYTNLTYEVSLTPPTDPRFYRLASRP